MEPRVGETFLISHDVTFETATAITSVLCTIYNAARTAVVSAQAGTVDSPAAAVEHTVSYLWTPTIAGDYVYHLTYSDGTQTWGVRGTVTVLSVVSPFDRWVRRVYDWLRDSRVGEAQAVLSERQVRENAVTATGEYEAVRPYRRTLDVPMVTNTFEYILPTDWADSFSSIDRLVYPVDDTEQDQDDLLLDTSEYEIDEPRSKWRFTDDVPTTGETARLYYNARHRLLDRPGTGTIAVSSTAITGTGTALLSEITPGDTLIVGTQTFIVATVTSDTAATVTVAANPAILTTAFTIQADTIPEADFDQVARYAAGLALQQIANEKAGESQPTIGAGLVYQRTKQQEYAAQAKAMMEAARTAWGARGAAVTSAIGRFDYLADHGAITYWDTGGTL